MSRVSVGFVALMLGAGCIHRPGSPTEALERARGQVDSNANASTLALAGFHALLIEGDTTKASTWFDSAVAQSAAEPVALMGQVVLAQLRATPQPALEAALSLIEYNPGHPLAPVAARTVLELAGLSRSTGALVLERVPAILKSEQQADTAQLLRSALANLFLERNDLLHHQAVMAAMGVPTVGTLLGPFSPWHHLATSDAVGPEQTGAIAEGAEGPFGQLAPRTMRFADGRFSLAGEPTSGDVYLYSVDVTVKTGGAYVLRTITSMDHVAVLDGTVVLSRLTTMRPASTLTSGVVDLEAGKHRLMVRMAREQQVGHLTIALHPLEGTAAELEFAPALGPAPQWAGVDVKRKTLGLYPTAESVRVALEPELGDALARFLAAHDGSGRDGDGARELLAGLPASLEGAAVAAWRADAALKDHSVPARVSHGRAARELESAMAKDAHLVLPRLMAARLALDEGRQLDALELARAARDAHRPVGAPVYQVLAQIELALGLDVAAAASARLAEEALSGSCEALMLQYDLARRNDAIAEADALLSRSGHCPGSLARSAEHLRSRGEVRGATAQWEALLAHDESQISVATSVVALLVAQKRFDEATALLTRLRAQWPRSPDVLKLLGDVYETAGRADDARTAREAALALDGADLPLRRTLSFQQSGKEVLQDYAINTQEALASYEAAPGSEDATVAFVLDSAVVQAFPDGSSVDRVHIIQKALDQQGVDEVAEVEIPAGATVLTLRTLKPDGRSLEPEHIEGKETKSLPGVQVGDLVEYEYLQAHPTRGPGQPGFVASPFYFQIARQPNARSSYVVIAPKGTGLQVDAHHLQVGKPAVEGDFEVFRHEERRVPPYVPEPGSPPAATEWLPFVAVGAGQKGNDGVVRAYADAFADYGRVTAEVAAFARTQLRVDASDIDRVRAIYTAVHQAISGRDAGLSMSAAASLALGRGSRLWLLKSALMAAGFDARLAAVRAFTADPAPYTFPHEALLPYVCLRVVLSGGEVLWLDSLVRFAPFGELPEFALGEREAWLMPEPGKPLEQVKTPERQARPGKRVELVMKLTEDGRLTGTGSETYAGFDAAELAENMESLTAEQRTQALQTALSRYFGGADLSNLKIEATRAVGANLTVSYDFAAPRFAQPNGDGRLVASSVTYPFQLGRRYVQVPSRVTPLFLGASEVSETKATLELPSGWQLADPLGEVTLRGPSGEYGRHETQSGKVLIIEENLRLNQSRVSPKDYEDFGQFVGEVDLVQQRDLRFEQQAESPRPCL